MLIPRPTLASLARRLRALPPGLRTVDVEVDIDPLELVRSGAAAFGHAAFFSSPDGPAIGTLGVAHRMSASGPARLRQLDAGLATLDADLPTMIGFAFADDGSSGTDWEGFPSATLIVPEVAVVRTDGRSRLWIALPPGAEGHLLLTLAATLRAPVAEPTARGENSVEARPAPTDWLGLVDEAIATIKAGTMQKVVLSRSVVVRADAAFEAFDLVSTLRDSHPECRVFGWQEGGATFIGASPELLVAREDHHFRLAPLAGSAARGADPEEDRRLGDELLGSAKNRTEHDLVVEDAVQRLRPLTTSLERPPGPILHRFATVQHLATPMSGTTDARLLTLADALHPTPAVGGSPRSEALAFIDKMEAIDRGWYAGGIGWASPDGTGEIALGLRSALIRGSQAIAYAGNGIVADSDPVAELEETRLKLRPMVDLLGWSQVPSPQSPERGGTGNG
ncbi:MAG TPA: isochorismate synthase [Acidimicrobiia bacterium]|nr:isochorismate synthase [Acidimicrobiia bacterium]